MYLSLPIHIGGLIDYLQYRVENRFLFTLWTSERWPSKFAVDTCSYKRIVYYFFNYQRRHTCTYAIAMYFCIFHVHVHIIYPHVIIVYGKIVIRMLSTGSIAQYLLPHLLLCCTLSSHRLEVEHDDVMTTRRNKSRQLNTCAIT